MVDAVLPPDVEADDLGNPPTGEADLEDGVVRGGRVEGETLGSGEVAGVGSEVGICCNEGDALSRSGGWGFVPRLFSGFAVAVHVLL